MTKNTVSALRTVNLELGKPTVEQALKKLNQAVFSAKASGAVVLKLIHGYGSSGKGGVIRLAILEDLEQKKTEGVIKEYVPGDGFSPFSAAGRKALAVMPELSKDRDYARGNRGITLVIF